jgi:hypothetical protein
LPGLIPPYAFRQTASKSLMATDPPAARKLVRNSAIYRELTSPTD